ncbi:hypothetical protein C3Y98_04480 [Methylotenera oryzisoli]|uniref:DUF4224 domain-containing protein n=1 Tax=Methylotenera oryzisoli TaxID=2080758 RepID=A0A4Y9VS85_9PROT|nr:DUF4224 domain-containing protein [Methylotenera oryzisoli]TFW72065.1 hypothetical protein C3Y98_04480 [Methylotenera oryzisoli]
MSLFLTQDEVTELTGIGRGRNGLTRNQLQVEQLRLMGIAFHVNAAGQAKVARAVIEGSKSVPSPKTTTWQSPLLNF